MKRNELIEDFCKEHNIDLQDQLWDIGFVELLVDEFLHREREMLERIEEPLKEVQDKCKDVYAENKYLYIKDYATAVFETLSLISQLKKEAI